MIVGHIRGISYPPIGKSLGSGVFSHYRSPALAAGNISHDEGSGDRPTKTNCSEALISRKLKILPERGRSPLHGINAAIDRRDLTLALEILERAGETGDRAIDALNVYQRVMGGGENA